jgi:hypothetical protein
VPQAGVADIPQRLLLGGEGTFSATIARASCRALFTDAREVFIMVAISAAEKPRTSKSSSAARWLPGTSFLGVVARAAAGRPAGPGQSHGHGLQHRADDISTT